LTPVSAGCFYSIETARDNVSATQANLAPVGCGFMAGCYLATRPLLPELKALVAVDMGEGLHLRRERGGK
jgi:hypothetical protein